MAFLKIINFRFPTALALMAAASPDLEKEGFFSSLSFYLSGIQRTAGSGS
jgi:hypothetical protein